MKKLNKVINKDVQLPNYELTTVIKKAVNNNNVMFAAYCKNFIDGKWYIPSGDNSLLLVDRYQGCEFEQRFPVCEGSVKSLSDYYDKITSSKCLMYEGRAYNGELCAGYAIAKCFDKYQTFLGSVT